MIAISSTFCSIFLTLTDFTLHFSRCFTTLLHSDFILLLNSFYTAGKVLLKRFTLMALLWKCGGFWGENILGRDMESDLFNIYSQLFGYNSPKKKLCKRSSTLPPHRCYTFKNQYVRHGEITGGTSCNSTHNSTIIPP